MRHNFTNSVSESLCEHSLPLSKCANDFKSNRVCTISELHAEQLTGTVTCTIEAGRVVTIVYKLHLFFILASVLKHSALARSPVDRALMHTCSAHTHTDTHRHTRLQIRRCIPGAVRLQQCRDHFHCTP